ncbi:MAG: hypothetical protein JWP31_1748, partial [Aeromicrobium sp.]|nr:hypothetical protein [Aeromicrobium sp.]
MRFFAGIVVGLALAASLPLVAQAADDPAAPASAPALEAVDVDQLTVPAPAGDATAQPQGSAARADDPAHLVAELPARRVGDFGLVGVTWSRGSDDTDLVVQVRLRVSGSWGTWEELHVDSDGGDVGRDGTEPLWAGDADGIAVRVTSPTGRRPAGLAVSTIDPGSTAASSSMAAAQVAPTAATYTARPSIVSRSAWGARKNTYCDSPRTGNETR